VKAAARLYEDFTGHEAEYSQTIDVPTPHTVLQIGKCDGILYETVRDGEVENYIHRFKKNSRPAFCVTHDGRQILLVGGRFKFTDRGIVDH
jgi:hypothetical protein